MSLHEYELERRQLIDDWGKYTAERLAKSLIKKKVGGTGDLDASIIYALVGMAGGDVGSVVHTFNYYGKFVDMGVGRGQKIESVKGNGEMIRLTGSGGGRKPKKWFSKVYFGEMHALQELLAAKYGEQGAEIIKESIQINISA